MTASRAKKRTGRPPIHGGYSLMVRAGELPKRRTVLRAYLSQVREGLILDLARTEEALTMAQRVLVDRAISLLSIIRCVEAHTAETGVFKGGELAPVLAKSYCTYSAELRRVLETLGIHSKAAERILAPYEIVDAERAERAQDGLTQVGEGIASLRPSRISGFSGRASRTSGAGGPGSFT